MKSFSSRMSQGPGSTNIMREHRKIRKPLMEKKRRARINTCLEELKDMLLEGKHSIVCPQGRKPMKLEKADILEMTVKHVKDLQEDAKFKEDAFMRFEAGFFECMREVRQCLANMTDLDPCIRERLFCHLQKCADHLLPPARVDADGKVRYRPHLYPVLTGGPMVVDPVVLRMNLNNNNNNNNSNMNKCERPATPSRLFPAPAPAHAADPAPGDSPNVGVAPRAAVGCGPIGAQAPPLASASASRRGPIGAFAERSSSAVGGRALVLADAAAGRVDPPGHRLRTGDHDVITDAQNNPSVPVNMASYRSTSSDLVTSSGWNSSSSSEEYSASCDETRSSSSVVVTLRRRPKQQTQDDRRYDSNDPNNDFWMDLSVAKSGTSSSSTDEDDETSEDDVEVGDDGSVTREPGLANRGSPVWRPW